MSADADRAREIIAGLDAEYRLSDPTVGQALALAQVHATLALAGAAVPDETHEERDLADAMFLQDRLRGQGYPTPAWEDMEGDDVAFWVHEARRYRRMFEGDRS